MVRLDDNLDPFDGTITIPTNEVEDQLDPDLTSAIESIEKEPPILFDGEE